MYPKPEMNYFEKGWLVAVDDEISIYEITGDLITLRSLRWRPGASAGTAIEILFVIDQNNIYELKASSCTSLSS